MELNKKTIKFNVPFIFLIMAFVLISSYTFSQKTSVIYQTIRGSVIDQETLSGLPGANIVLLDTDPVIAATADMDGNFRIEKVPIGRYDIEVSYIGFKTVTYSAIQITSSKELVLDVQMQEDAYLIDQVNVTAYSDKSGTINSMSTISARTFSAEETRRYAGGMDDPARMASAFAGVTVGNIQDNSIIIRGNAPRGVLWRLEGVAIPNPSHFAGANVAGGGFTTLFSNHLLANSDFFTGAFPSEYGNALAGVFDISFRNGNNENREYALQLGVMGVDLAAEGPFIKDKKASYLINYRYSTFGLIKSFIPSEQIPEYQDLSFKFNFPMNNGGTISFWGIGGNDRNSEPVTRDSTQWIYDWDRVKYDLTTNVGVAGITYKQILNEKSYMHSSIVASTNSFNMDMKRMNNNLILQDSLLFDNTESKYTLSTFVNVKISNKHTNRTGLIVDNIRYNTLVQGPYEGEIIDFNNSKGNSFLFQAYSQSKINLGSRTLLNLGIHSQYYGLTSNFSIEPRLGLNYNLNSKSTLSLGYGNHSQLEPLKVYLYQSCNNGQVEYPNDNLEFSKAHHIVIGYDYTINSNMRLKLEPYYQYLYNIPVVEGGTWSMINYEQDFLFNKSLVNDGTGRNVGVDLTLERFLNNNYYYLVTASIFDSKYTAGNGIEYNTRFNKNYVFTLLGGKEFNFDNKNGKISILGVNARVSIMGGHRLIPVDEPLSYQEQAIYYDWSNPYVNQNPADLFVDLTITYRINKNNHSSIWTFQVKNITGSPSNYMYQYNLKDNIVENTSQTVMVPSISYKFEF